MQTAFGDKSCSSFDGNFECGRKQVGQESDNDKDLQP
jgi:hypothetical protein